MAPFSFGSFSFYLLVVSFSFSSIVYMHLNLGQETQPPCFLEVFSFICWLFSLLFYYIVYRLTKTNVTCVPKSVLYNG
jgi:hypothetical protein